MRIDDALLPLLPSLVALIEESGVGRAATRMGISQPRMSARLSRLRTLLEDPLLVPASGTRGYLATDRAKQIARAARLMLADLDVAIAVDDFDAARAERTFAIMTNDNAAAILCLPLVHAIRAEAGPRIRCALHHFDAARLGDLEDGRLDLVLGAPAQFDRMASLRRRTVLRDQFVAAVRRGASPPTDLDTYCARDHVLVSSDGGGFEGAVDRALAGHGRKRRVALSVQTYLLAIEAVATSDMVATLPRALVATHGDRLQIFAPPLRLPSFTLAAAWHPRTDSDPAHRWLRTRLEPAKRG